MTEHESGDLGDKERDQEVEGQVVGGAVDDIGPVVAQHRQNLSNSTTHAEAPVKLGDEALEERVTKEILGVVEVSSEDGKGDD